MTPPNDAGSSWSREAALEALQEANAELAVLNERLQQAADDQAQFLAVTAHELRTPVALLSGSADLLAEHGAALSEEERQETFRAMTSGATRLRRLVDDLLTASRLQSSALVMRHDVVRVPSCVRAAVDTVRRTHPTADVRVGELPGALVRGDPDRLAQALENLLTNALRHGRPPVEVSVRREGDRVLVQVTDHGAGVAPQIRPRLFERFATGLTSGGTGLGLFIVRELARAHGGEAHYLEPGPDRPGAFVVDLPALASDADDPRLRTGVGCAQWPSAYSSWTTSCTSGDSCAARCASGAASRSSARPTTAPTRCG